MNILLFSPGFFLWDAIKTICHFVQADWKEWEVAKSCCGKVSNRLYGDYETGLSRRRSYLSSGVLI